MEDERTKVELSRLSAPKLAELWTNRPAQRQVLSNVLYQRGGRSERARIAERMAGWPLSELARVVAEELKP